MARPYLGGTTAGVKELTASTTLQVADSGKTILFTPPSSAGALVITLPAASNTGLEFTIIQKSAYDTAVCKVLSADGNNLVGNIDAQTGTGDNAAGTDDFIQWGSGTVAGDYVKIVSNGTNWYVVGSCSKVTTNGIAFGAS
jgi:hypothetical protein|tara:strand:+ start:61 stop:483 length:423 start_codon:yes stop_codon:yes gene_type:complete